MKSKQEMLALLNETAATYNSTNRSVEITPDGHELCKYFTSADCGCAIGRLIPDKELCQRLDALAKYGSSVVTDIYKLLPENLQEYPIDFLSQLQKLHDKEFNWVATGISEVGKQKVEEIKVQFELTEN